MKYLVVLVLALSLGCANLPWPTPMEQISATGDAWENTNHSVIDTGVAYIALPIYLGIYVPLVMLSGWGWYRDNVVDYCLHNPCSSGEILYDEHGNVIGELY